MRSEHADIRALYLTDLRAALHAGEAARYEDLHYRLFGALSSHHLAEERMLYPVSDAARYCTGQIWRANGGQTIPR